MRGALQRAPWWKYEVSGSALWVPPHPIDPDVASAIQSEIDQLEGFGVNKIILISHLQNIGEDQDLAPELSGVDIIIAGGGDEMLSNEGDLLVPGDVRFKECPDLPARCYPLFATGADGANIPVVTTAGDYKYVGRLVAGFDKDGNLVGIDYENSGPVRVSGVEPDAVAPDPAIEAQVTAPVEVFVTALDANVIGVSEVALEGRRDPGIRTQETNEGNLLADALRWQATALAASFGQPDPDVGLQNGGGIRNNTLIPAGDITELTTFDIAPFSNFVTIVPDIPREQFKEILENAVSRSPDANGRFAQVSGFTMAYDVNGTPQALDEDGNVLTPGTRVREVVLDDSTVIVTGGAVVPGPDLTIATIDFLARGGDEYPYRGAAFTTVGVVYQQALRDYIVDALGGLITAAQYPEVPVDGGVRIIRLP
jgi:5'-nucleotidase